MNIWASLSAFICADQWLKSFYSGLIIADELIITKATQCVIGWQYRSNFQINKIKQLFYNKPKLIDSVTNGKHCNLHLAVLENLNNISVEEMKKLVPLNITIFISLHPSFIISDVPVFYHNSQRFIVINKKICLCIEKGTSCGINNTYEVNNSFVKWVNNKIAISAREWIIGENQIQLEKYIEIFASEEYKKERDNEDYEHIVPEYIDRGYIF